MIEKSNELINGAKAKMADAVHFLEEDLKTYRAGKANPMVFNNVLVDYYGSMMPIAQVASITVPDSKTIAIQPWEKNMIPVIEKAIMDANIGFTPQNNGEFIRIIVPSLTEERRKELVKKVKQETEQHKVTIRNIRRNGNDTAKKLKENGIPEDEQKKLEEDIQKLTNEYIAKLDKMSEMKEKEIMTV